MNKKSMWEGKKFTISICPRDIKSCHHAASRRVKLWSLREGTFLIGGGGVGRGILEIFCEKSRGTPTSQIRLMHDPSQIPKQKHLTLPPPPQRQK